MTREMPISEMRDSVGVTVFFFFFLLGWKKSWDLKNFKYTNFEMVLRHPRWVYESRIHERGGGWL